MNAGRFQVFWTRTAQQDLREIQAGRIYADIREKAGNLGQMPQHGRIVPELRYFGILIYRELIVTPWRIIYKIEGDKVWVLAVIDGRRNVEDILLNRFL